MNTQSQSTQSQSIQPIEVHIACILKDLQEMIRDQEITPLNVLSICINAMKSVEVIPKLSSQQKKQIVLEVMTRLIQQSKSDNALLLTLSHFIDTAISIEKGDIQISVTPEEMVGCCLGLCTFATKK